MGALSLNAPLGAASACFPFASLTAALNPVSLPRPVRKKVVFVAGQTISVSLARLLSFTDRPRPYVARSLVRPSPLGEDLRAKPPIKMKTFLGRLSLSSLKVGGRAEIPEAPDDGDDNWRDSNEWKASLLRKYACFARQQAA